MLNTLNILQNAQVSKKMQVYARIIKKTLEYTQYAPLRSNTLQYAPIRTSKQENARKLFKAV